ncbi:DUF6612 family protein [Bacillus sp. FJAT-44742]|uniref:DUF6612 family protein n=1 Tax=Bacillus sp. FJAT-44742 TaxID=2014005 RepID=UPI0012FEC25F|nr:DUF6612 family protein [Bacillus sp. FJAT-44742]
MQRRMWLSLLLFSIFYVTGCVNTEEEASTRSISSIDETAGGDREGESETTSHEMIKNMENSLNTMTSYTMEMNIRENRMRADKEEFLKEVFLQSEVKFQPFSLHKSYETMIHQGTGEEMYSEFYINEGGYYLFHSNENTWRRVPPPVAEQALAFVEAENSMDEHLQFPFQAFSRASIIEKDEKYVISFKDIGVNIEELNTHIYRLMGDQAGVSLTDGPLNVTFDSLTYILTFHKETFEVSGLSIDLHFITPSEEGGLPADIIIRGTFSGINDTTPSLPPRPVQEEALEIEEEEMIYNVDVSWAE